MIKSELSEAQVQANVTVSGPDGYQIIMPLLAPTPQLRPRQTEFSWSVGAESGKNMLKSELSEAYVYANDTFVKKTNTLFSDDVNNCWITTISMATWQLLKAHSSIVDMFDMFLQTSTDR